MTTSSASSDEPSWNFTPVRSLHVQTLASLFGAHVRASAGSTAAPSTSPRYALVDPTCPIGISGTWSWIRELALAYAPARADGVGLPRPSARALATSAIGLPNSFDPEPNCGSRKPLGSG